MVDLLETSLVCSTLSRSSLMSNIAEHSAPPVSQQVFVIFELVCKVYILIANVHLFIA